MKPSLSARGLLPAPRTLSSLGDTVSESTCGVRPEASTFSALLLVLHGLPLDARACCACVCKAWRDAAHTPALWLDVSFEGCQRRITKAVLQNLLSVSGTSLLRLSLHDSPCVSADITAFAVTRALCVGGCTELRELVLFPERKRYGKQARKQQLTSEFVGLLLQNCPALEHLESRIQGDSKYCAHILAALCSLSGHVSLDMRFDSIPVLSSEFPRCITELRFGDSVPPLSEELDAQEMSRRLRFESACTSLFNDLCLNGTLAKLHITGSFCRIWGTRDFDGTGAIFSIAESFRTNTSLKELVLKGIYVNDSNVLLLSKSLCVNRTLTVLSLEANPIQNAGAFALAEMLRTNCALTSLDPSNTPIRREGVSALAEVLALRDNISRLAFNSMSSLSNSDARALQSLHRRYPAFDISTDSDSW